MLLECGKGTTHESGSDVSSLLPLPAFTAEITKVSKMVAELLTEETSAVWKCNWKIKHEVI